MGSPTELMPMGSPTEHTRTALTAKIARIKNKLNLNALKTALQAEDLNCRIYQSQSRGQLNDKCCKNRSGESKHASNFFGQFLFL
jgi:hypothetical protein